MVDFVITMEQHLDIMEEELKTPKPKGGAREGAGRKAKSKDGELHRIGFRCSQDVWDILQMVSNKTEFIEKAIREKWKRGTW